MTMWHKETIIVFVISFNWIFFSISFVRVSNTLTIGFIFPFII
jgi:hypothetical protein